MTDITLNTVCSSEIHCGEGALIKHAQCIKGRKFIVTDTNVNKLYSNLIEKYFADATVTILTFLGYIFIYVHAFVCISRECRCP